MKAKAASKSTNLKLRWIASRSLARFQSGKRFRALRKASISSLAMSVSQFIVALDAIDAAVAGQHAGIKMERADLEFDAGIKCVMGQPLHHLARFRMAHPRHRHMRREFVRILGGVDPADGGIDL